MPNLNDAKLLLTGSSRRGWHRLQLAAECLQKYAWKYKTPPDPTAPAPPPSEVGGIPLFGTTAPPLVRGSLMHLALGHRYARMREEQQGGNPNDWVEPLEAVELVAKLNGVESHIGLIQKVYRAYETHWRGEENYRKILEVEALYETKIRGKYLLTGRIDLLWEDLDGRIWVQDHKTGGRIQAAHKEFYAISGQLIGYQHLVREKYGERLAGMKLNLVQVAEQTHFENISLARSPNLETRFEQTVEDIEKSIEALEASGRPHDDWPKAMNEMTCFGRYGACEFIDRCRFGAEMKKKGGNWSWGE